MPSVAVLVQAQLFLKVPEVAPMGISVAKHKLLFRMKRLISEIFTVFVLIVYCLQIRYKWKEVYGERVLAPLSDSLTICHDRAGAHSFLQPQTIVSLMLKRWLGWRCLVSTGPRSGVLSYFIPKWCRLLVHIP